MKKSLFLCLLLFLAPFLSAEELKFVTVLSSPVGTFNKLEAVDTSVPAKSPTINFCTSIGTGGTVTLKGSSKPEMKTVNLSQNTILGRADEGSYVLNQITMKSGGTLKGSRLLANTVQVQYKTAGKSEKLYTDTLTVAGAKAGKLNVNNGESQITESYSDPGMIWSNEYQTDGACGTQAQCAKQYLLKEKREITVHTCPETAGDPRTWWDASAQKCGCPSANERYHNGACCSESTPTSDTRCWKKSTDTGGNLVWSQVLASDSTYTQNIANQGVTSLTCSTQGIIGWAGGVKTSRKCPHYSCSGSCALNCNSLGGGIGGGSQTIIPNPNPGFSSMDGGACTTEGDICVASVSISVNDSGCQNKGAGYNYLYCGIHYTYSTCVKSTTSTTSYTKLWSTADTRYSCGH